MLFNNDGCVVLALIYQTEHIAYVFATQFEISYFHLVLVFEMKRMG